MKLVFRKEQPSQVEVQQILDDKVSDFSYIDMMKSLLKGERLELGLLAGDFSKEEEASINSMVSHINKTLEKEQSIDSEAEKNGEDAEEDWDIADDSDEDITDIPF